MSIGRLSLGLGLSLAAAGCGASRDSLGVLSTAGTDGGARASAQGEIADGGASLADGASDRARSSRGPDATVGDVNQVPTSPVTPVSIDQTGADNPAGLSPAEVSKLTAGGPRGDLKWLYPYAETVFPRGMLPPLLMWNGDPAADAVYLHIKSKLFEYRGVLKPTTAADLELSNLFAPLWNQVASTRGVQATGKQLLIPQAVWDQAGMTSLGRDDPFTLELSERANGEVRGVITTHISIAQADFKGSVYYSACTSSNPNAGASTGLSAIGGNGKVFRIPPRGTAQLVLSPPGQADGRCQGCHAVSADGSRLIAQRAPSHDERLLQTLPEGIGLSYRLGTQGADLTASMVGPNAAFGALYPDGSHFLSAALPPSLTDTSDPDYSLSAFAFVHSYGGVRSSDKLNPATLYDASNGAITSDTGIPQTAMMPAFSPDGRHLVFNDFSIAGAHGLALMDYDTQNHKASDYRVLVQEPRGAIRPGWPFFLPDDRAVVFVRTESASFTAYPGADAQTPASADSLPGVTSDLYIADVASGKVTLLAKAMGFDQPGDPDEKSYLPFAQLDLHRNYFPTVWQVAAGGYFWVFFDTWRHFGNLGVQRGIWGFAVDIRADGYGLDPSHPPFYLPGQEFGAGNNHRAFVSLEPCKAEGDECTSGIDCCGGFCSAAADRPRGACIPPPPRCANLDEHCASAADCCDSSQQCINNFCAYIPLL